MYSEHLKENYHKELGTRLQWYMGGFSVAVLLMFSALPMYLHLRESNPFGSDDWSDTVYFIVFIFPGVLGIFTSWLGSVDSKLTRMIFKPDEDLLEWKYRKSVLSLWILFFGSILYFLVIKIVNAGPMADLLGLVFIGLIQGAAGKTLSELSTQKHDQIEKIE